MPAIYGVKSTAVQMNFYAICYLAAIAALAIFSYAGFAYLVVMLTVSIWWLLVLAKGLRTNKHTPWARSVFLRSLLILPTFGIMLSITVWLP